MDYFNCGRFPQLISRSRAAFEKVTVTQLVKNFYASYGTRRLIIMLRTAHHLIIIYSCYDKAHSSSFLDYDNVQVRMA
jgi:hypothetical protein